MAVNNCDVCGKELASHRSTAQSLKFNSTYYPKSEKGKLWLCPSCSKEDEIEYAHEHFQEKIDFLETAVLTGQKEINEKSKEIAKLNRVIKDQIMLLAAVIAGEKP